MPLTNDGDADSKDNGVAIRQGLRQNLGQFAILIVVNAFVGAMIGLEQTVVPLIGKDLFGIESATIILSFIASFGLVKAVLNLYAGALAERWGRKKVLIVGWLFGIPVPFILLSAPDWNWVIFANVLLGVNQALAWSMTVNMKIDLVGKEKPQACTGRRLSSGLCYGDAGNDNLTLSTDVSGVAYGGRGNDYFSSTLGAGIWFYGQEGDDTLVGNDEQTNMAGGRGADTFVCNQEGEDIIVDYRPEQDSDVIENQVVR